MKRTNRKVKQISYWYQGTKGKNYYDSICQDSFPLAGSTFKTKIDSYEELMLAPSMFSPQFE